MADPVVLSGSSLTTFLRCGQQWYYAYVERIKRPPNTKTAVGTAGHKAIEVNLSQKVLSRVDLPIEQVVDAFSDEWQAILPEIELAPDEDGKVENPGKAKDSGIAAVRVHHTNVAPRIQPLWVEREVQFEVNGHPYAGTVDLVDQHQVVRDWKFTSRKPSGSDYVLNMTGYALGYRQATGAVEHGVTLDYMVRTKEPYHHPISSGGAIDDRTIGIFSRIVDGVYDDINAGRFRPNGLVGQACSWCGYRDICPAYRARRL